MTLYQRSPNTSRILKLVRCYVVIRSRTCRHCEISKKLTLNPTLSAKNTPLFLLSDTRRLLKIFAWGMPLHAHVFSFTHNAVVLSQFRCVHVKNQTKFFLILTFLWIKTNVAIQDLKWSLEQRSALQVYHRFQTDLLLCIVNYFLQWALPQNMANGDLAFYHTLHLWLWHHTHSQNGMKFTNNLSLE